jgi:TolB-like protein/DNA-binding winged helix-turn-helix (wHTH) protein
MQTLSSRRVRFGVFELNLSTGELRSTESPDPNNKVLLREQVFQVLRMLLEREGQIVTRDEIKERLWPDDTVVDFDSSINATIKALRRALGDSADTPRYVETLARRGYRLMPDVEWLESAPGTGLEKDREQHEQPAAGMSHNVGEVQRQLRSHRWKPAVVLTAVVILVGTGFLFWRQFRAPVPPRKIMLAVLPFENLTGDPNKEYLADGLTDETISQLGRLNPDQLGVIARTSVMGYKHKNERLDQIGRDLSVQYVLENSLHGSGDHIHVNAQLIQVKDLRRLWFKEYDYSAKDILNLKGDVAKAVAREIRVNPASDQDAGLSRARPVNPEAFDNYMKGYYFFERSTDQDTNMAASYFERAIHLDPSYALAWVGLSRARYWQANVGLVPAEEGQQLARDAAERALALEPNLPEANIQMGRLKRQVDFDWAGADVSIQRAIALEPGVPENLGQAAFMAVLFGRFDEASRLDSQALQLDPLNAESWERVADDRFFAGQLDDAVADIRRALELNPDNWGSPVMLSQIYLVQGRPQDALREGERIQFGVLRARDSAVAYYALGRKKESDAALKELIEKYHGTYAIAAVYAQRNERDEAFKWLDRAYSQHDGGLIFLKIDPLLKNLRSDPRYTAFLNKLHLPTT